ncbi:hypothetical protein PG985_009661 [Apiospora marii]|uniref:uncharacterized protein n=1 Tax=Apiospora marii TaxID=335849 RepID=UPI00312CD195
MSLCLQVRDDNQLGHGTAEGALLLALRCATLDLAAEGKIWYWDGSNNNDEVAPGQELFKGVFILRDYVL